ncbi:MAG: sulfotransferase [Desulfobacteraceae bacterium]|nr:sulfotransferase [Desulfobacteraceae bacterium]
MRNYNTFSEVSPVFIIGAARSGTTLLQLMLNAHPDISIMGEVHFFDQVMRIKEYVPEIVSENDVEACFDQLEKVYSFQYLPGIENILAVVKARLKKEGGISYEKIYNALMEETGRLAGAKRYGEKTPENIRYLDQLVRTFPNCKIVHIIRDPRAVAASNQKVPWTSGTVIASALKWKCEMYASSSFAKKYKNYYELRYEDLISDTEYELRNVCRFIEEPFDFCMFDFYKQSEKFLKNEPWKKGALKPVGTDPMLKWKRELSLFQLAAIEVIAGRLIGKYGYGYSRNSIEKSIMFPVVFIGEMYKYVKYILGKRRDRTSEDSDLIAPEEMTLLKLVLKYAFK